jgi:hypothetical protein
LCLPFGPVLFAFGSGGRPALLLSTVGDRGISAGTSQLCLEQPVHDLRDAGALIERALANCVPKGIRHSDGEEHFLATL